MDTSIKEIAERIKGLRELSELSQQELAEQTNIPLETYIAYESGTLDFSFTALNNISEKLGIDLIELLTGENPHLSRYGIVRKGKGLNIKRCEGLIYEHLCYNFKNKLAECFHVTVPYIESQQNMPISLSAHEGQEFDYVLSGSLKIQLDNHTEILYEGDSIYYNSSRPHGVAAAGNKDCIILAVTIHQNPNKD